MYNANNYGYNPYGAYIPQRNIQQPLQTTLQTTAEMQRPMLSGKQISDIETVKVIEYPLDGSISYFPLTDGSAIVTKQLQADGTSKTIVYKPIEDKKVEVKYATIDELKKEIDKIDLSDIDDLKEEIKEIKKAIKDLKKKGD